jgi:hypothetical protein
VDRLAVRPAVGEFGETTAVDAYCPVRTPIGVMWFMFA